jgi:hypothetical protein
LLIIVAASRCQLENSAFNARGPTGRFQGSDILWFPIVLGFRQRDVAKWMALPCLIFWLAIMIFIWLFLLGWARIVSGHFSSVEVAMTLIIGATCIAGLGVTLWWRTNVSRATAVAMVMLFAAFQLAAFRISLIPYIATR